MILIVRLSNFIRSRVWREINLRPKLLSCTGLILVCFSATNVHAQQSADRMKMAAVLSIVTNYLLDERKEPIPQPEGLGVVLSRNQISPITYVIDSSEQIYAEFELQQGTVELCFYITANQVINPAIALTVEVNGEQKPARVGENCYVFTDSIQREINYVSLRVNTPGVEITLTTLELATTNQSQLGLPSTSRSSWSERSVRKVLNVFAFGGHATDSQIIAWADMRPQEAIVEMLNFSEHNLKLSPLVQGERYTSVASAHGTLGAFYQHIGSPSSNIPVPLDARDYLDIDGYRFASTFGRMVAMRGLNPFRQRIGFWETNYHLATNRDAGVSREQMVRYYDDIMEAHEDRLPYHEVIGVAAKSAAVAMQYGHRRNQWVFRNGEFVCECNYDFAREIHQLFYGIFGANDPNHEDGTIVETGKMLTDMRVPYIEDFGFDVEVTFEADDHHTGSLTILGQTVSGANASAKIDNLMPISMQHPESLQNLPVMIIEVLADDNLSETSKNQLRSSWASMGQNKDFLAFIQAYATSTLFHSAGQRKYLTSFERAFLLANKFNINNIEAYFSNDYFFNGRVGLEIDDVMEGDNASEVFSPLHNVFGGQNSSEASDSAVAFEKNYNRSATQEAYQFGNALPVECDECDQGSAWAKDWSDVIPATGNGYPASYVAAWLWRHVFGNFDHYTELERAHLLAILGTDRELSVHSYHLDDTYTYYDLNSLLCLRDDRLDDGQTNNSVAQMLTYDSWNDYCRNGDDGHADYSPSELAAFSLTFNGNALQTSSADPYPYLRGVVNELAVRQIEFNSGNEIKRRRANERVQAALAFIFAGPFVFAEGG